MCKRPRKTFDVYFLIRDHTTRYGVPFIADNLYNFKSKTYIKLNELMKK